MDNTTRQLETPDSILTSPQCPICSFDQAGVVTALPFELEAGSVETPIQRCDQCGCYWRIFPERTNIDSHWRDRSYTKFENEDVNRKARYPFFADLVKWSLRNAQCGSSRPRVLDVGCSYGHMMELFERHGCYCVGTELVDRLREKIESAGKFAVYRSIFDLPRELTFDVITLIDSLYYFEDPVDCLMQLRNRLSPTSVIVVRVTNRTPLLNMWGRVLRKKISRGMFGDQLFAFSHKGMQICFERAGLKVRSVRFFEKKNLAGRGFEGFFYYRILPVVAASTRLKVTPGLTYLCSPK